MITEKNEATNREIKRAKETACEVIAHHFGSKKPRRIEHKSAGLSNFVFAVSHAEGDFIVRISPEQTRIDSFIKEQWAQNKARAAGVPVPEILEVGIIDQPFMISRVVGGEQATFHPQRWEIVKEMGRYAALIHTIETKGFGSTFDWSNNRLSRNESWEEFLENELKFEEKLETLARRKMIPAARIKKIRRILLSAAGEKTKTVLNHGDMRLKNVMVDDQGRITAFLDWEHAMSNIAPVWEFSISLHDFSIDEKQLFLKGYGLKEKKIAELMPAVKAINLINYAPQVERLAIEKDAEHLEKYRTRLSGALDLYSLC